MGAVLDNFQAFITRAGFRILQVPDTPQEYVGQHLLYAYLDHFIRVVGANMFLEVQTGRGRMDLLIVHNQQKHIVETKIWEGERSYQAGKQQLATYLKLEGVREGLLYRILSSVDSRDAGGDRNSGRCNGSKLCYSCGARTPLSGLDSARLVKVIVGASSLITIL